MNAAPADQRRLLDLAELDSRVLATDARRSRPPQAARVQELLTARRELSHELARREGGLDDLRAELGRLESDVKVVEARRARDEQLLQTVTSPKDAQGIEHELASLARRQGELEDGELVLMERIEAAEASVAEQRERITATNDEGASLSAEAKQVVAEATAELERLNRDRDAVRSSLPDDLRALYEKLTSRGTGAALLRARTCGGCHMVLAGTDLKVIADTPADVVVTCPECGCILVRTQESGL